jgi:mRNA interferase HigB
MGAFMRIIACRPLLEYVNSRVGQPDHPALKAALGAWFAEVRRAKWARPANIKRRYAAASIISGERGVFNISGNAHGLVVAIDFEKAIV